jgi:cis-L-3-hydroxyproline dehydratase
MQLTDQERAMLDGAQGEVVREALDYIVQFGEAFDAARLVDITYCHYPAEMAIYPGSVEDAVSYSARGGRVRVPTTTSTLCADLERLDATGCPAALSALQAQIAPAHRALGLLETYTCTPQLLGFIPPFGSYIASVESSAIIYFNSVLGARTNRGGLFTRFSAITGKYPLMGYLLDANRRGTHLFQVRIPPERLASYHAWTALGFHIGALVGGGVPVITGVRPDRQEWLLGLGAALATSGSVTLFHIPGVTPEARSVEEAFQGRPPCEVHDVTERDLSDVYDKLRTIAPGAPIDFVTLGCPHYNLEQLRWVAEMLQGRRMAHGVRMWVCTNRMTRAQAASGGYVQAIEAAGALVVADTCPVESHMRQSTCREYGLAAPNVEAMVTDSAKMARYVGDLIGCKTALVSSEQCIAAALSGKLG